METEHPQERLDAIMQVLNTVSPGVKSEYLGNEFNCADAPKFRLIIVNRLFIIIVPRNFIDDNDPAEIIGKFSRIDWKGYLDSATPPKQIEYGILINEY